MRNRPLLNAATFTLLFTIMSVSSSAAENEISFKTEDGWTIYGTLSIPEQSKDKVPLIVLLPSESHDRTAFGIYRYPGQYQYPGLAPVITSRGVATLSLDLRGRGKSMGTKEQHAFSREELAKVYLDVRAALAFLQAQPEVDSSRIGIVAEGESAEAAVKGWNGDRRVSAIALISGRLSETAKRQMAESPDLPMLLVVSSEDKGGFADMTDAYFLSKSKESNIEIYNGLGVGTAMFSVWRYKYPKEKPLQDRIGEWIADQVLR